MNEQIFSLQPCPSVSPRPPFQIAGTIARQANRLVMSYTLSGNLAEVVLPPPTALPSRQHELWQATCFEFFLGIQHSSQYWEFNLSPSGHWNVYRFSDYRQGMQEEMAFASLPFGVQTQENARSLSVDLDLTALIAVNQALEVAIATVIQHRDGKVTYWALTHRGVEADFHRRDSFIVQLS